jgi:phage-related minor tail protein
MEGFSGPALEAEMQKAELDQLALQKISAINEKKASGNLLDTEAAAKIRDITAANIEAKEAVDALTEAQTTNSGALQDYISGAQDYLNDVQGRMAEIAGVIEQSISSAIMGLVNGTMTATEAFHNFFKSIGQAFLKMATQMIAKLIIIKLLKAAIGMFGGGGDTPDPNELNIDGIQKYMTPTLPMDEFAKGGIVTRPTNALIGEGGMNEAVVPLPNGKAIPVDMKGASGGGNVTSNVTVNVSNEGSSSDSDPNGPAKLGKAIDTAVRKVIMDERRSGGLLSQMYTGR